MREDPLLHPDQEDGAELETLGVVEGHERDEALLLGERVLIRVERDLLEELRQARLRRRLLVLARDAHELHEVFHAPLRFDRPLGLERLEVAAALQHALDQLWDRQLERSRHEGLEQATEALHGLQRRGADAGLVGTRERLPHGDPLRVGEGGEPCERGIADSRRGRLAMRASETASYALSITCRYAIAS